MGIGFDVFKANIGWNLADSVMGSISNAIEKNAQENAERQKIEKEALNKSDMLKTLVFMIGNNIIIDRNEKKAIASILSKIYDKNISLFSIEEEIDNTYSELKSKKIKDFFSSITAINTDREQTCLIYVVMLLLYMQLSEDNMVLPVHTYNLALIKQYFEINRKELAECYTALANKLEQDTDDIADFFEELTSDESINKIKTENPTIVCNEIEEKNSAPIICENPKEEIEKEYYALIQNIDSDEEFKKRFFLADSNPKKTISAVNAYAKNCRDEEILAVYDDSSFCNGKVGFLLTNKKLYICNSFEKPQEIELDIIQSIVPSPKLFNSFITVNNIKIETAMLNGAATEFVASFLQKAIPLAIQIKIKCE